LENVILTQLYSFLLYLISGIIIGIFFDIFRILRKAFNTPDIITYIEDILFWILTGSFLLVILFKFSDGQLRIYQIIGTLAGVIIYMISISKFFIKINVKIIITIKKVLYQILKIILYPIKFIIKLITKIFNPFTFFVININKNILNCSKKVIKRLKIDNKTEKNSRERRILKRNVEKYN